MGECLDVRGGKWGYTHVVLFVVGVLTFGFFDGVTAVLMMEKWGVYAEANQLLRELVLTQGATGFLAFKVIIAALILSVPLLLHKRSGDMHWKAAGFLSVFTIEGAVAAIDNYVFMIRGQVWIEARMVIVLFLVMMILALQIGDLMDNPSEHPRLCGRNWQKPCGC